MARSLAAQSLLAFSRNSTVLPKTRPNRDAPCTSPSAHSVCRAVRASSAEPNNGSRTPPTGCMSWHTFRCETGCADFPAPSMEQADALVSTGLLDAGLTTIHVDDCILRSQRPRPANALASTHPTRFPSGFKAARDYLRAGDISFGVYTAESTGTCDGWPGSRGYERSDVCRVGHRLFSSKLRGAETRRTTRRGTQRWVWPSRLRAAH